LAELRDTMSISDIRATINFAEARAEKIGATRQAHISKLSTVMDGFEDEMAIGRLPPQSALEDAGKAVAYYGSEKSQRRFNEIVENVETVRLVRSYSPGQVDRYLESLESALDEETGTEQRASLARQIKIVSDYQANLQQEIDAGNHLQFFSQSGQIDVSTFDPSNAVASIEARRSDLQDVGAILLQGLDIPEGQEPSFTQMTQGVNFFTPEEVANIGRYVDGLTPIQKAGFAQDMQLAAKFAPQLWEELDKGDAKLFAVSGAIGDVVVAEKIFMGQSMIDAKTVDRPTEKEFMPVFQDYVGDVYRLQGAPGENEQIVMEAVLAHYAATRTDRVEFKEPEFLRSMEAVTGGIGEVNGFKLELPRGVEQDRFETWIERFSPEMIEYFAPDGVAGMTNEEAADLVRRSRIQSIGNNRYAVVYSATNQEAVFKRDGMPMVISWDDEIARMIADQAPRRRTRLQERERRRGE